MASSVCLPKIQQTLQILLRALLKLRIVWQITEETSIFICSTFFKGRKMKLQATFLYRCTAIYFHIQGEQKGIADPNFHFRFHFRPEFHFDTLLPHTGFAH